METLFFIFYFQKVWFFIFNIPLAYSFSFNNTLFLELLWAIPSSEDTQAEELEISQEIHDMVLETGST